jgi:CopG family nickel-responsive transcriptional regulator
MQRITISVEDTLAETFDRMIAAKAYASRSEALRDAMREEVERWLAERGTGGFWVANLSYVYDRRIGSLAERLAAIEQEHHDIVASSSRMPLDHHHSFVSVFFRGRTSVVRSVINKITALRGVRLSKSNFIAVSPHNQHERSGSHSHGGHGHLSPVSE